MKSEKSGRNGTTNISAAVYDSKDKMKQTGNGLREKQLTHRESLFTVLFENPHVKTFHHIVVALFLAFMITTILRDYLDDHEVVLGFQLIRSGFVNLPIALIGWVLYFLLTCSTYFCFKIWANVRIKFSPSNGSFRKIWDWSSLLSLMVYYIFSFKLAVYIVTTYHLAPASAAIVLLEQTRMLMKVHAFVRSNAPRVLEYKPKSEKKLNLAPFSHFVYFILAPTLMYRDEYPRTSNIRWNAVFYYAVEIVGILLFYAFIMARFVIPAYREFGITKFTYKELVLRVLETSFPGILYLSISNYLILHVVQNFFAEITQFGDRMFYKDWWTSTDFNTYYRSWNVVVHDWLYTYIYKDCYEFLVPKNKTFAKYSTFLISSLVHEWIIMNMMGFFYPAMIILFFGFSVILTNLKMGTSSFVSTIFWLNLSYGSGIMLSGYSLEYFARTNNVPPVNEEFDFYIPRSITCDCYI